MVSAVDRKTEGPVQPGQVIVPEAPGLALPESHPGHSLAVLDLVIQGSGITTDVESSGKTVQPPAGLLVHQFRRIKHNPGTQEIFPAGDALELFPDSDPDLLGRG